MSELLIGCGKNRTKKVSLNGDTEWRDVITLDYNPDHEPDVLWDLNQIPLPFPPRTFDEIHAYDVLEHCGTQGDYRFFFSQFSDFYRILKPDGLFCAIVPHWQSVWAWGDPSHTRILPLEMLTFLSQDQYERQVGVTAMSDFRDIYLADFELVWEQKAGDSQGFILRAVK